MEVIDSNLSAPQGFELEALVGVSGAGASEILSITTSEPAQAGESKDLFHLRTSKDFGCPYALREVFHMMLTTHQRESS